MKPVILSIFALAVGQMLALYLRLVHNQASQAKLGVQ